MTSWLDTDRVAGRALAFFAVIALPFLRHLVRLEYPWWHIEVVAALAVFALVPVALAIVTVRRTWFLTAFALWVALMSASAVSTAWFGPQEWVPWSRWAVFFAAIAAVALSAAMVLRTQFVTLTVVLLAGMLAAEAGLAAVARVRAFTSPRVAAAANVPHVIHLVFDGQIGIAGFPTHLPEAAAAAQAWRDTLVEHGFTVYDHAFSNYNGTRNSLPSILNDRLVTHDLELMGANNRVAATGRLERARQRHLALAVYQSDFVRFADAGADTTVHEYPVGAPVPMPADVASLTQRTEILIGWYGRLDRLGAALLNRVPEGRFVSNQWPLNARRVWPGPLKDDVHAATRPTYFFAHVMMPHPPYAFDADGRLRPRDLWSISSPRTPDVASYEAQYREYAGQSLLVARELDALLDDFARTGVLDRAEVLIHGDHGARLHVEDDSIESLDDLPHTPGLVRRLIDTYSTLLAVRRPGAAEGRVDDTTAGIVRLLRRAEGRPDGPEADALDRVYRFQDGRREPSSLVMHDYWKD